MASKTTKTGKMTAVVTVMSIFKKKYANCGALILEMRGLLIKRRKEQFSGGKYPRIEKPFSKIKKRPDTKEISIKIKEIRAKLH
jgi:hypothetical protein